MGLRAPSLSSGLGPCGTSPQSMEGKMPPVLEHLEHHKRFRSAVLGTEAETRVRSGLTHGDTRPRWLHAQTDPTRRGEDVGTPQLPGQRECRMARRLWKSLAVS